VPAEDEQVLSSVGIIVTLRKTHPSAAETLNLEQQVTCLMSETIIMYQFYLKSVTLYKN